MDESSVGHVSVLDGSLVLAPDVRPSSLSVTDTRRANTFGRYWIYQVARAIQALTMGADFRVLAEKHAKEIIAIERWLHIDCELSLQKFVMKTDWLLIFFNK